MKLKNKLTILFLPLTLSSYSQTDTINAVVFNNGSAVYDLVRDTVEYHLKTSDSDVLCEKQMYDHVLLNVPYRAVFVTKTDGSKWLIKVETYTTE